MPLLWSSVTLPPISLLAYLYMALDALSIAMKYGIKSIKIIFMEYHF